MNILVLGGTQFFGRAFVEKALRNGHTLTLFNRGMSNPLPIPGVETLIGDRQKNGDRLSGKSFDAVLDTCGYFPDNMREIVNLLKDSARQYVFVSSCSVYNSENPGVTSLDESAPSVSLDVDPNEAGPATYGARKFLCEIEVQKAFPKNHFIVRPGLIVGAHDPTYRFSYWVDRVQEGGDILAPGDPRAPVQWIDADDLATWVLGGVEKDLMGTFNAASPIGEWTLGSLLEELVANINPQARLHWVSEKFLREKQVACWTELPLWVYEELRGFFKVDSRRAMNSGLKFGPLTRTIEDILRERREPDFVRPKSQTLSRARESSLLAQVSNL